PVVSTSERELQRDVAGKRRIGLLVLLDRFFVLLFIEKLVAALDRTGDVGADGDSADLHFLVRRFRWGSGGLWRGCRLHLDLHRRQALAFCQTGAHLPELVAGSLDVDVPPAGSDA